VKSDFFPMYGYTGLPTRKLFKDKLSVKKKENVKITFLKSSQIAKNVTN
jgi:hypothetical protein